MKHRGGLDCLQGLLTLKTRAKIDIAACRFSGETFPHTLIHGIGGIGKTAFARAIADELQYLFIEKEAAAFRYRSEIIEFLQESDQKARKSEHPLLVFIDECHRLTVRQQEVFYFPMAELRVDQGDDHWYNMNPFTLFTATTHIERLDQNSFVKRFNNVWKMEPHHPVFMERILQQMFANLSIDCDYMHIHRLSLICGGIPRTAWNLAQKLRRHALAHHRSSIRTSDVDNVLRLEGY